MGSVSFFFFMMFTVVLSLYDPLGTDIDDLDVDIMLLSTEKAMYSMLRSRIRGTPEHSGQTRCQMPMSNTLKTDNGHFLSNPMAAGNMAAYQHQHHRKHGGGGKDDTLHESLIAEPP